MENIMSYTYVIGGVVGALFLFYLIRQIIKLRVVVPANMVHIVQTTKRSTSYGNNSNSGNTYYAWASWIPVIGVTVVEYPISIFPIGLKSYDAYDSDRIPFEVDVTAFFRLENPIEVARKVSSFKDLESQLISVVQGVVRRILATNKLELIMEERSLLGKQYTEEIQNQIKEWGIVCAKDVEFMDLRDSANSTVIKQIMAKQMSRIDMESRTSIAENKQKAETAEINAGRAIELQKQDAAEKVGIRKAEVNKQVGIQEQNTAQEIATHAKITTEKELEVINARETNQAAIDKNVAVIKAQQEQDVAKIKAEQDQSVMVTIANAELEKSKKSAEAIKTVGEAEAAAEQAKLQAPVQAQILLAKEIGENEPYQNYLVSLKQIDANISVGIEMAKGIQAAEIKLFVNSGDVNSGISKITDVFSTKGGSAFANMLSGLSSTPEGTNMMEGIGKIVNLLGNKGNDGSSSTES